MHKQADQNDDYALSLVLNLYLTANVSGQLGLLMMDATELLGELTDHGFDAID